MKKLCLLLIACLSGISAITAQEPVAHWTFDDIRVERKIVDMVRGETYVPKEVFAYVKESVSGKENELNGASLAKLFKDFSQDRDGLLKMANTSRSLSRPAATDHVTDLCMEVAYA